MVVILSKMSNWRTVITFLLEFVDLKLTQRCYSVSLLSLVDWIKELMQDQ